MTDVFSMSEEFTAVCGDIYGCMDESALNYDADATTDNGSCIYPCTGLDASVNISTDLYASDVMGTRCRWRFSYFRIRVLGRQPTDVCLVDGAHTKWL